MGPARFLLRQVAVRHTSLQLSLPVLSMQFYLRFEQTSNSWKHKPELISKSNMEHKSSLSLMEGNNILGVVMTVYSVYIIST